MPESMRKGRKKCNSLGLRTHRMTIPLKSKVMFNAQIPLAIKGTQTNTYPVFHFLKYISD